MKKLLLVCLALSLVLFYVALVSAADSETINGWVSDSKCAAKGANAGHADCAKKCIAAGEKMVLVTDKDKKVLTVENADALAGHEGHHVSVKGTVNGDSVNVEAGSVKMLAQK